jgi:hypothetical protein
VWLASTDPSATWPLVGAVAAGGLTLASGLCTAWFAFRGSSRATDAQREAALDAAVDADRATLRTERDDLRDQLRNAVTERDDYRERWVRLRLDVICVGLDPDLIPNQRTGRGQP